MRIEDDLISEVNYESSSCNRLTANAHQVVKQNRMPDKVKWVAKVKIESIWSWELTRGEIKSSYQIGFRFGFWKTVLTGIQFMCKMM
jgi:hypothetical protein